MATERQYWVISPMVDGHQRFPGWQPFDHWRQVILANHVAVLGHQPGTHVQERFANRIRLGDIVLIARGKTSVDIVGFGVVKGRAKLEVFGPSSRKYSVRRLDPFVPCGAPPEEVLVRDIVRRHTMALVQLHPDPISDPSAQSVCTWLAGELKVEPPGSTPIDDIHLNSAPISSTYDYEVMTAQQVREAQRREKALLDEYTR